MEQTSPAPAPQRPPSSGENSRRLFRQINERFRARILELDSREICLFLPHCLRSRDCPAESGEEGIRCRNCGRCSVGPLFAAAEAGGVRAFCVPGGSLLEKIVRERRPAAVLGVACDKEIRLAVEQNLKSGRLRGIVATNSLELGIDIGDLDLCILVGYPGSVMATWQRSGRVGRSGQEAALDIRWAE